MAPGSSARALVLAMALFGAVAGQGCRDGEAPAPSAEASAVPVAEARGGDTPAARGEVPAFLGELADVAAMRARFNADKGKARVIVLLEPG